MYCVVDKRVAVETAQTCHRIVRVVTNTTVAMDQPQFKDLRKVILRKYCNCGLGSFLIFLHCSFSFSWSSSKVSGLLVDSDPMSWKTEIIFYKI